MSVNTHGESDTGGIDEGEQLRVVVKNLALTFPDVPVRDIADEVQRARTVFDGAKIRTYIPVLIQHRVRQSLSRPSPA